MASNAAGFHVAIDRDRLRRLVNTPTAARSSAGRVSQDVLDTTLRDEPSCRCSELGLAAGMYVEELILLGSGCTGETIDGRRIRPLGTPGWVCRRLDTVRRRCGV